MDANSQPVIENDILAPPPERIEFTERALKGEPDGDRVLILANGMRIRERMTITDRRTDGILTTAQNPAAAALTIAISCALLDESNRIVLRNGQPVIAPAHEVVFTNEALGRLGSAEAVNQAMLDARQVAAARAALAFHGAFLLDAALQGRA